MRIILIELLRFQKGEIFLGQKYSKQSHQQNLTPRQIRYDLLRKTFYFIKQKNVKRQKRNFASLSFSLFCQKKKKNTQTNFGNWQPVQNLLIVSQTHKITTEKKRFKFSKLFKTSHPFFSKK